MNNLLTTSQSAGISAEDELLVNAAHALVGRHAQNKETADEFIKWLVSPHYGQKVIRAFETGREKTSQKPSASYFSSPFTPPPTPPQNKWKYF